LGPSLSVLLHILTFNRRAWQDVRLARRSSLTKTIELKIPSHTLCIFPMFLVNVVYGAYRARLIKAWKSLIGVLPQSGINRLLPQGVLSSDSLDCMVSFIFRGVQRPDTSQAWSLCLAFNDFLLCFTSLQIEVDNRSVLVPLSSDHISICVTATIISRSTHGAGLTPLSIIIPTGETI